MTMSSIAVHSVTVAAIVLTGATSSARAQIDTAGLREERSVPELLTAVPENAAFIYLGITPTNISRPGSIRDFGAAVLNLVDENGNVRSGFALEASPWTLIPGLSVPLDRYQSNWLAFVLANTQLSLATTRTSGDEGPTDLAVGLRLTLYDAADPMRDREFTRMLAERLRAALANCDGLTDANPDVPEDLVQRCVDREMRRANQEFSTESANRWNAMRLAVGVASGWQFAESRLGDGSSSGFRGWLTGAAPVHDFGQLLAQLTYTHRPRLGTDSRFNLLSYGARLAVGASTFNAFLDVVGEARSGTTDGTDDTYAIWSGGVEFRVGSGLWLSTGFGSRYSALNEETSTFVVADIRWGTSSASRLQGLRDPPSR